MAEFVPGLTTRPPLAPLAPYGSVRGRVPPEAMKPGVSVRLRHGDSTDDGREFPCDADSRFHAADLEAGPWWVSAQAGRERVTAGRQVVLGPGRSVTDLALAKAPPPEPRPAGPAQVAPANDREKTTTWALGSPRRRRQATARRHRLRRRHVPRRDAVG